MPGSCADFASRRAALAGFLTAEADELIAGQYSDRPRLRPVLDAVLAALPALGPVTVEARGTIVGIVGPRRTFAVVKATTKSRVETVPVTHRRRDRARTPRRRSVRP